MRPSHPHDWRRLRGFTLVELLVVIVIIASLAALAMVGVPRWMDQGRKVSAISQIKEVKLAFAAFESENGRRPLLPRDRRNQGLDTVYGAPGGQYSNAIVVSVLSGQIVGKAKETANLKLEDYCQVVSKYTAFKNADKRRNGVGDDGVLYDAWGQPWMFAVNAYNAPGQDLQEVNRKNPGKNDKLLFTYGLGEYSDSKPGEEDFVMWTYGKDGKMGVGGAQPKPGDKAKAPKVAPKLHGSDDIVSW